MKSFTFNRIKKKTLALSYSISPEELAEILNTIKYKKLFQCVLKSDLEKLCEEQTIKHSNNFSNLLKLNKTLLASGTHDMLIKIWDLHNGIILKTLYGHTDGVYTIILLTQTRIASGSGDLLIKIWDFSAGNCLKTLTGHAANINSLVKFSETLIVSGSMDNSIKYGILQKEIV